jgi:serine/threonine protein kinase
MPTGTNLQEASHQSRWKTLKRELAALDILSSNYLINPTEFVKTKHHCYIVKEYANGGSVAQLLLYRSQVSNPTKDSLAFNHKKRLSENEAKKVMADVIGAIADVYERGFAIWDLSTETLLLTIGAELVSTQYIADDLAKDTFENQELTSPNISETSCNFAEIDSLMRN